MDTIFDLNAVSLFAGLYVGFMLMFGYLLLSNKPFVSRLSDMQIIVLIAFAPIIVLFEIIDSILFKIHSKPQQS